LRECRRVVIGDRWKLKIDVIEIGRGRGELRKVKRGGGRGRDVFGNRGECWKIIKFVFDYGTV
jgi:hypothetical protein